MAHKIRLKLLSRLRREPVSRVFNVERHTTEDIKPDIKCNLEACARAILPKSVAPVQIHVTSDEKYAGSALLPESPQDGELAPI